MRVMNILVLMCLFWAFVSSPASAAWVEAKSENFILVGDTSEKNAKKIVTELEKYRMIIFALFNVEAQPEMMPVHIYATRSNSVVTDVTGMSGAAGVYRNSREGPVFILNIKGGFTLKSQARAIAMHEYTHHLISQYTNLMYPRWVNEGMAEYLSTFSVNKKGEVKIGLPKEGRGYTLANNTWMDMNTLVGAIRQYPYGNNGRSRTGEAQQNFYAQSWLAVHYLQSTPGMAQKLSSYLRGIPLAENPQEFFTQTFGMTPDDFGKDLKTYFRKNNYPGRKVTVTQDLNFFDVETRKLHKGETEFKRGEAVRRFGRAKDRSKLAEKYYTRAEELEGPIAQIEASRALFALEENDEVLAVQKAEKAFALEPKNGRIIHVLAKVRLAQYSNKETLSEMGQIEEARELFVKAMRANPQNMQTHFDYVTTYTLTNDPASKQAIYSAQESSFYYRAMAFIGDNMRLVPFLLQNGEKDYARFHLQRAQLWATKPSARRAATRMIENLEKAE